MTGRFDGMLICSDFDGTLFDGTKISKEDASAIRFFQENGGNFTITSGRHPKFLGKHRHCVDANTYLIGLNGTIISSYDGKSVLRQGFLQVEAQNVVKRIVNEVDGIAMLDFSTTEIPDIIKGYCEAPDGEGYFRYLPKECDPKLLDVAFSCKIYRIIFHTAEPVSDHITEQIREIAGGNYAVSRSSPCGIEIQNAAYTKGIGARYLANHIGAHTLICVGDYENDISMIQEADIGCAVANAIPSLRSVADRILPAVDQYPFAELIASL